MTVKPEISKLVGVLKAEPHMLTCRRLFGKPERRNVPERTVVKSLIHLIYIVAIFGTRFLASPDI